MKEIQCNDYGTNFQLNLTNADGSVLDVSQATALFVKLMRPDHTYVELPVYPLTDGKDGKVQFWTVQGNITMSGVYKFQVSITAPTGLWSSAIQTFKVLANL